MSVHQVSDLNGVASTEGLILLESLERITIKGKGTSADSHRVILGGGLAQGFSNLLALVKNSFCSQKNADQENKQQGNLDADQPPGNLVGRLPHLEGKKLFQGLHATVEVRYLIRQSIPHLRTTWLHVAVVDDFLVYRLQFSKAFVRRMPKTISFLKQGRTPEITQ